MFWFCGSEIHSSQLTQDPRGIIRAPLWKSNERSWLGLGNRGRLSLRWRQDLHSRKEFINSLNMTSVHILVPAFSVLLSIN